MKDGVQSFVLKDSSKRCLWNLFLKEILKRVFFVMALVSIRMHTKCLSFENVSNECWCIKCFCCEQARN